MSDQRDIDKYIPNGELADRQTAELALVGLSARFPAVVDGLNDALTNTMLTNPNSFVGYRFTLSPDLDRPKVTAEEARYFPYDVTIEADILGHATFEVKAKPEFRRDMGQRLPVIQWVTLEELHQFESAYPYADPLVISADALQPSKDEPSRVFNTLQGIGSMLDFANLGLDDPNYREQSLGFDHGAHTGLVLPLIYETHAGRSDRNFGVTEIFARDTSGNIEEIILAYASLVGNLANS
jgi:hypothetical protein